MSVDLYYAPLSSPCRAVLLTAEAIGFPLNLKELDIFAGENQTPEYEEVSNLKMIYFFLFLGNFDRKIIINRYKHGLPKLYGLSKLGFTKNLCD